MRTEVMFSSKTEMWETPQDFFDKLDDEFHFTLDVCASSSNHKCGLYFSEDDNGLEQSWSGHTAWCNPPYGRNKTGEWVRKAMQETRSPNTTVVLLLPARTDTAWFHDYILGFAEIRFIRGRLKFGGSKNGAPFPSMVVVFGEKCKKGGG